MSAAASAAPAYAELAVTSNFSFLTGASHPEELVAQALRLGLAGLGIADRNTLAGVVRAHVAWTETGARAAGLRLAVGARLVFADGTPDLLAHTRLHLNQELTLLLAEGTGVFAGESVTRRLDRLAFALGVPAATRTEV